MMIEVRATPLSSESHQLEMWLSKACKTSDCRASIDHPESFILELLMVKYLVWVLSLLMLAWCWKGAVPIFFSPFYCSFFFKDE